MSPKVILAAVVAAAFIVSGPNNSASAQTPAVKEETAKPAQKMSKAEARKAAAAERKAKLAERKAQAKAARKAAHERQKECGAEWKKAKVDGKVEKWMTWSKYYSACNKRLKEKAA